MRAELSKRGDWYQLIEHELKHLTSCELFTMNEEMQLNMKAATTHR